MKLNKKIRPLPTPRWGMRLAWRPDMIDKPRSWQGRCHRHCEAEHGADLEMPTGDRMGSKRSRSRAWERQIGRWSWSSAGTRQVEVSAGLEPSRGRHFTLSSLGIHAALTRHVRGLCHDAGTGDCGDERAVTNGTQSRSFGPHSKPESLEPESLENDHAAQGIAFETALVRITERRGVRAKMRSADRSGG